MPVPRLTRLSPWWLICAVSAVGLMLGVYGLSKPPVLTPLQQVHQQYVADLARLDSAVQQLKQGIDSRQSEATLRQRLFTARLAWKRVEFLAELYNPETAKSINGANLPEVDEVDKKVEQPEGLQVIEAGLFPHDPANQAELVQQAAMLVSNVGRLGKVAATNEMTDSHVFDAMRLDVFRVISLGITGFDAPLAHTSIPEAAEALESLRRHLTFYDLRNRDEALSLQLDRAFTDAIAQLRQSPDFNQFDRLTFIAKRANPLSSLLLDAQQSLDIPVFRENRLLSPSARTLNDPDAFDPAYFVSSTDDRPTTERVELGKLLFFDPVLSGNGQRTCATCHQPDRAFTDGETKSLAVGSGSAARNAPTLLNAALQASQFMDSRVVYLEDQAGDVIANKTEMHGSLTTAVQTMQQQAHYRQLFAKAYSAGVTEQTVKNALASYVRSLSEMDSRVDKHLRGQAVALTPAEQQGFNLFMGKGQCATCHFFPLFNGTVPPAYAKTESEVLGTPATAANKTLDTDLGRFRTTDMAEHRYAFKTPTVRHSARTAPYMHNGVYRTLEEVIDFYNRGGGQGLGFNLPNQTLPPYSLHLTRSEQAALVAFLKAL
ncbi:cytochrome-c peroxidase [Spirosoma rhododendri]|uniref:Cytochrome-c peroxidase n=2 Tax=Spirosoma rhododendri TaxID=2728024 RepID=A0A7L5DSF6_9BACT|nr:cytochrome-c peroxidase [Spirosoma rhododendri]